MILPLASTSHPEALSKSYCIRIFDKLCIIQIEIGAAANAATRACCHFSSSFLFFLSLPLSSLPTSSTFLVSHPCASRHGFNDLTTVRRRKSCFGDFSKCPAISCLVAGLRVLVSWVRYVRQQEARRNALFTFCCSSWQ